MGSLPKCNQFITCIEFQAGAFGRVTRVGDFKVMPCGIADGFHKDSLGF